MIKANFIFPHLSPKAILVLLCIIGYTMILGLWKIGQIPPLSKTTLLSYRFSNLCIGIVIVLEIFYWTYLLIHNIKISIINAAVCTLQPLFIQEIRIFSPPLATISIILATFIILIINKNILIRGLVGFISIIVIFLFYPPPFSTIGLLSPHMLLSYWRNVASALSFDYLFFQNNNFWFGGLREAGVLLPVLIPLFIIGFLHIYKIPKYIRYIAIWFFCVLLITILNPVFPEGRNMYLIYPLYILVIGLGFVKLVRNLRSNISSFILLIILISLISYNLSETLHLYFVHYQQRIEYDIINIHEKF